MYRHAFVSEGWVSCVYLQSRKWTCAKFSNVTALQRHTLYTGNTKALKGNHSMG